jgi:surface antigen
MGFAGLEGNTVHRLHRCFTFAILALGGALAGCSINFPMMSLVSEPETTGSIVQAVNLSAEPVQDDHGIESSAVDKALDPLHSGGPVAWSNPATGQNGSVAAAGEAFVRDDQVCRSFNATLNQNKPGPAQDAARRS